MNCSINLVWIPSHIGIPGNERADQLAGPKVPKAHSLISQIQYSTVMNWTKSTTLELFQKYLAEHTPDSMSNEFAVPRSRFRKQQANPIPGTYPDRRAEISLFRLLSGHHNLGAHWFRRGRKMPSYMCRKCKRYLETAEHVLLQCPAIPLPNSPNAARLRHLRSQCDSFREFLGLSNTETQALLIERIIELKNHGVVL